MTDTIDITLTNEELRTVINALHRSLSEHYKAKCLEEKEVNGCSNLYSKLGMLLIQSEMIKSFSDDIVNKEAARRVMQKLEDHSEQS